MQAPLNEILNHLDTRDDTLKSMIHAFTECKTRLRADELIKAIKCKEEEYSSDFRAAAKKPFCSVLSAAAHFLNHRYTQASGVLKDAERGFACSGQEWNLAMARWMHALVHLQTDQADLARQDLEKAGQILGRFSLEYQRKGRYEDSEACQALISRMKTSSGPVPAQPSRSQPKAQSPKVQPLSPAASPLSPKPPFSRPQPVVFPIYDPVSAGEGGNFIFDSQPQGHASISQLFIDGKPFQIFSMRPAEPAILQPRIYRWLYVIGDSMNRSTPYPLTEGDCILVMETDSSGLSPKADDIVVAALLEPSGPAERAGVVKRLTSGGLCSESSQAHPPIPLKKVKIKGIVLAVAKPVET